MKILIIENEYYLSACLQQFVRQLGHEASGICVTSGQAIDSVHQEKPDLVMVDIMLDGDIDGIETVIALRKICPDLPVIFITGSVDPTNRRRAAEVGFSDFIVKPFDFSDIANSLQQLES